MHVFFTFVTDDEFELGGKHCFMIDGYSAVAEKVAEYLGNEKIHFSTIVSKIETLGDVKQGTSSMKVQTISAKDSSKLKTYGADYVLVTVPLGILKEKRIDFVPGLPSWKTEAIELLGFGLLNKIVMKFPSMFWDSKLDYIGAVNDNDRGFCYIFWNLYPCCKEAVLTGLVAGKTAFDIEKRKDEELVKDAVEILRKSFGKDKVQDPISYIVTKWHSEEWSRGSYSFIGVNATGLHYDRLASPVYESTLFFSGEATSRCHPATVLGAVTSGIFAAGVIDKFDHATLIERQSLIEKQELIEPVFDTDENEKESEEKQDEVPDDIEEETLEEFKHRGHKRSVFSSRSNSTYNNKRSNKEVIDQKEKNESHKKKKALDHKEEILSQGTISKAVNTVGKNSIHSNITMPPTNIPPFQNIFMNPLLLFPGFSVNGKNTSNNAEKK